MEFERGGKRAERGWQHIQTVSKAEHDALWAELGGESEGECLLQEVTPEGSDSTTPREWQVIAQ